MNILVLELESLAEEISGVGQTTLSISKSWLSAGHKVNLMIPENFPDYLAMQHLFEKANILSVAPTPKKRSLVSVSLLYAKRMLQSAKINLKLILESQVDYIFADSNISLYVAYSVKLLNYLKYRHCPTVIIPFYHITPRNSAYKKGFIKTIEHMSLIVALGFANQRLSPFFFTESTFTAKMLSQDYSVPRDRILVLGGGIEDSVAESVSKLGSDKKSFDACFIGRIHPAKGIFDLVNAWDIVRTRFPNAKLAIIGGGYPLYRKELENMITKLNLQNNIELCGQVSNEDKFRILSKSKVLVHPAYEECIPLTFFEAAAVGVPIITYYLPTYENVAECLIPVKKGDIEQLAVTLTKGILSFDAGGSDFEKLLKNEKELVGKHTWNYIAKAILDNASEPKCES